MTENKLKHALACAADDPASRPDFFRILLNSEIYVIGHSDVPIEGHAVLSVGSKLAIMAWERKDGTSITPFFTSLETLRASLEEDAKFLVMSARNFFEIVKGRRLVLNPSSGYSKEFSPSEVEALLSTGVNHVPTERIIQEATQVSLGQPANYPAKMVAALKAFLPRHPNIHAVHLCLMEEPGANTKPSLVVGFKGSGDIKLTMKEAGTMAIGTAPPGTPVDFVEIVEGEPGLGAYLLSVDAFYRRKWSTKLKSLFSR